MNFFTVYNDVLNPETVSRVALHIDETPEKTKKALDALMYSVYGGLLKRTTSEIGVNQLFKQVQRPQYDGTLSDQLATTLKDPAATNALIAAGNETISHLLPAMKSSIGSMVSTYAGIRNSSAISLLGLTTSVVLDVLGRQVRERKLDADLLAASLFDQRESFVNAVPDELLPKLVDKMGIQQVVAGVATPARRTVSADIPLRSSGSGRATTSPVISYAPEPDNESETASLVKWAVGALLVLAVAAGGYYIYQNTQQYTDGTSRSIPLTSDTVTADTVARSLAVPADSATTRPVSATTSAVPGAARPDTVSGLTTALRAYLSNPMLPKGRTFTLRGVSFVPGTAQFTPGSDIAVNQLADLLKAFPAAQIQLQGFANDANGNGFTNRSLSFKRVNVIKQQLVAAGINYIRVDAVGFGTGVTYKPGDPTTGGRAPLRQIDVKVVAK